MSGATEKLWRLSKGATAQISQETERGVMFREQGEVAIKEK